jgi:hypothetical protein
VKERSQRREKSSNSAVERQVLLRIIFRPTCPTGYDRSSPFTRKSGVPASGRWRAPVDSCQTARSVEHVMAVSD